MAKDETDLDFVSMLNTALPFEKHLPGMRYCGPGTKLDLRVDENGNPHPGNEPVDRVDQAALKHDLAYSKYEDLRRRNHADKEMLHDLYEIKQPTCRERLERCIVFPIMCVKCLIGSLILRIFRRK
jgi:Phospholipase A2-like domain